ncbi:Mediator of RNA polymerase II transcription subunit 20 [Oopsacas minuta]|uniref:Mediator of RNA polymerase II transcription subunit 20 n=1 Tax=Oopsacas minuta TaxID=111878 RepID=A0AAV7KDI5_9METZ|nr:Mediator of RNA polymerase II transcription subunit 20 [Oopsacas minuta]
MVVVMLISWESPEGMSPGHANEKLQKKIEILGGKILGKWDVDCEVYSSLNGIVGLSDTQTTQPANLGGATAPQQAIYVLHNSNYSLSTFAILEDNTVLIADSSFDQFMPHMKVFYKKGQRSDAKGNRYELNEFIIKTGVATFGGSQQKILLLEITYLLSDYVHESIGIIRELAKLLLDNSFPGIETPITVREDKKFSPSDLLLQYKALFSHVKKPSTVK